MVELMRGGVAEMLDRKQFVLLVGKRWKHLPSLRILYISASRAM